MLMIKPVFLVTRLFGLKRESVICLHTVQHQVRVQSNWCWRVSLSEMGMT